MNSASRMITGTSAQSMRGQWMKIIGTPTLASMGMALIYAEQ